MVKVIIVGHSDDPRYGLETEQKVIEYLRNDLMTIEERRYRCKIVRYLDAERILFSWKANIYGVIWVSGTLPLIEADGKEYKTVFDVYKVELAPNLIPTKELDYGKVPVQQGAQLKENEYNRYRTMAGLPPETLSDINQIELSEEERTQYSKLEQESLIKVRIGQSEFRQKLIQKYHSCIICGIENRNLLISSHIKPWKDSDNAEKLDPDNGLLLCANHDRLFDKGLITIDNDEIIISPELDKKSEKLLIPISKLSISFSPKTLNYLKYHRENIFKKNIAFD